MAEGKKIDRVMIGETPYGEPIIKEESTGKTFIYMPTEKADTLEKLRIEREKEQEQGKKKEQEKGKEKEKGKFMTDENTTKLESKIAKLEAKLASDEKAKYDKLMEGLIQKVDTACTEIGGCRKDIGDLRSRIDKDKEKVEKDSKDTCVGLDCIKKDLKAGQEKLSKLEKLDKLDKISDSRFEKLDKLDRLELYDCPECNKKIVPLYPEPANYCPSCGKPAAWLEDDGKPLKSWHPPWKK